MKTTSEVADAIEDMRGALKQHYGADFSFVVMGHGHVIGASSLVHGVVVAEAYDDAEEEQPERTKGDDDGQEYGDPRDYRDGKE